MKSRLIFISVLLLTMRSFSQTDSTVVVHKYPKISLSKDSSDTSPVQVSFIYPLGTNGIHSPQVSNNFSFNALYGVNGGVNGCEIGGLVNVNTSDVNGIQIGGIANITAGGSDGTVVGGIANIVQDSTHGIFVAGISNVVGKSSSGFELAGISNTVNGNFDGGQLSGIANYTNGSVNGFQLSGIANFSNGDLNGAQISGIINTVNGNVNGTQIGLINYADTIKGTQIGLINVARSGDDAVVIGLISLVHNGYHALEFSTSESVYGQLALKLGVPQFYSSFRFGITQNNNEGILTYGYGIGSMISMNEKNKIGFDLSANQTITHFFDYDLDLLNRFEITYRRFAGKHFEFFAGPALNVYVTQNWNENSYGSLHIPYTVYDETWSDGRVAMWVGLQAGAALRF
jgi:hypothetical protein